MSNNRYADDFVILCNGTKTQAEAMREELHGFLKADLKLNLSLEKTKVTHLNDGFKYLGFWIQRKTGQKGMTTKALIPPESIDKVIDKITEVTDLGTYQDSANTTILALNRIIGGWYRYYQYTSRAATTFRKVEYTAFWKLAHWLNRKYQLNMPEVMRRYRRNGTLGTSAYQLYKANQFPTRQYQKRFLKPNPYTMKEVNIQREELPTDTYWSGHEAQPGMADLRPVIRGRDKHTCQNCGIGPLPDHKLEVDHIRPVRRFKRPMDANNPKNLQTLCIACHQSKTKFDQQMESPVR
jgi:5-methylcytosine-specific restriction endonuclease McrA